MISSGKAICLLRDGDAKKARDGQPPWPWPSEMIV